MISTLSLGLTLLWGAVLAFGCRLFLAVAEGIRSAAAAVFYYGLGGAVCFLSTSLFLYGVTGGVWHFYCLAAMTAGFLLFLRLAPAGGRKSAARLAASAAFAVSLGRKAAAVCGAVLTFPFGFLVDKGERSVSWLRREKTRKKEQKAAGNGASAPPSSPSLSSTASSASSSSSPSATGGRRGKR